MSKLNSEELHYPEATKMAVNKDAGKMVLRCLAWVATISVWKHEIEFGCEQVNHGFEVADSAGNREPLLWRLGRGC